MEISFYDKKTQDLINTCEQLSIIGDDKALSYLNKLIKIANKNKDNSLLGFSYFYCANYHYDKGKYEKFHNDLKQAIYYLLRSENYEMLARSYNFFAIDAQSIDSLDVAYSYYASALKFTDADTSPGVAGIIISNIANFYYFIGDFKTARKFIRKGRSLLTKNNKDAFYEHNLLGNYINDGLNSIAMKDIKEAKAIFKKAQKIYEAMEQKHMRDVVLAYKFFEVRLSLLSKNKDNSKQLIKELIEDLKQEEVVYGYMDDIRDFCYDLIKNKSYKEVGKIIDSISDRVYASNYGHAIRILTEIKVEYYDCTKCERKLINTLREQHSLLLQQKIEKDKLYRYSMKLIELVGDLQEEESKVRLENEDLQIQIMTDSLTKIANRYAFDKEIFETFERIYKNNTNLGVEIMDVDGFKVFNDNYGHQVGDVCLAKIGEVLKDISKKEKIFVARYGGDEFVAIYENKTNKEIERIAKKIRDEISKCVIEYKGKKIDHTLSISQGICNSKSRIKTKYWDYLSEADIALYEVKNNRFDNSGILIRKLKSFSGAK